MGAPGIFSKKQVETGNYRLGVFRKFVLQNGLNWHKFLCIKAGNCSKKAHRDDQIYKDEMECEAAIVGAVTLHVELSGLTGKSFRELMKNLKEN